MALHSILKMGDPRLLRVAQPVTAFDTDDLHRLVQDMRETMRAAHRIDQPGRNAPGQ